MTINELINLVKEKVNFKEPRYMLPAILYPLLLIAGYLILGLFSVDLAETKVSKLQSTEFLNPELPEAQLSGKELSGRREALENTYGGVTDFSAVEGIEREAKKGYDEYESRYTEEELSSMDDRAKTRATEMERLLNESKERGEGLASNIEDKPLQSTSIDERDRLRRTEKAQQQAIEDLEKALAEARLGGQKGVAGFSSKPGDASIDENALGQSGGLNSEKPSASIVGPDNQPNVQDPTGQATTKSSNGISGENGTITSPNYKRAGVGASIINPSAANQAIETTETKEVIKAMNPNSSYFNSIAENDPNPLLIRAIIDEDIKATDKSRVRLKLLDPIEIDDKILPKGTYLYATMTGFGGQRVKGLVENILVDGELIKVSLTIYDMDGLEGLYVPKSSFREAAEDVLSGTANTNVSIGSGSYSNSFSRWGMQAAQNAYNRVSSAISKNIKKNKAKLKYGSFVYLVNKK